MFVSLLAGDNISSVQIEYEGRKRPRTPSVFILGLRIFQGPQVTCIEFQEKICGELSRGKFYIKHILVEGVYILRKIQKTRENNDRYGFCIRDPRKGNCEECPKFTLSFLSLGNPIQLLLARKFYFFFYF